MQLYGLRYVLYCSVHIDKPGCGCGFGCCAEISCGCEDCGFGSVTIDCGLGEISCRQGSCGWAGGCDAGEDGWDCEGTCGSGEDGWDCGGTCGDGEDGWDCGGTSGGGDVGCGMGCDGCGWTGDDATGLITENINRYKPN